MRKIISSIDVGTNYIKLVVGEFSYGKFNILSAIKVETSGIQDGHIVNSEALINSIKKCVKIASDSLGVDIKKIILGINLHQPKIIKSIGEIKIKRENNVITGDDVINVIDRCADGKVDEDYTLIGTLPVSFCIDEERVVDDPKGETGSSLALKGIVITSRKEPVRDMIRIVESAGLKVIDVIPNAVGNYYAYKNKESDASIISVVNIGYETTTVGIYNKGIMTNMKTLDMGTKNIISDIAYVKRLDMGTAYALYKDIALSTSNLANPNEYRLVKDLENEEIKINQFEVSEICESRINELLNLIKKQINILTKKEISYIIISGGLSELKDIQLSIQEIMGKSGKLGYINLIGARDNSLASAIGILKYFNEKLELRGRTFSIFATDELKDMNNGSNDSNKDNSLLGRVFGYFFDS